MQSKVFTAIKTKVSEKIQTKYPNIYFTTSDKTLTNPRFPTVYLKKLQGTEQGETMEKDLDAIVSSFQVEVTDNANEANCIEIADLVMDVMNDMGYSVLGDSVQDNTDSVYRNIARYQRTIVKEDVRCDLKPF